MSVSIKYSIYTTTHMDRLVNEYALHRVNSDLFICIYDARRFLNAEAKMMIVARERLKVPSFVIHPDLEQIKNINLPFYNLLIKNVDCIREDKLHGRFLSLSIPVQMFNDYILPEMEEHTVPHGFP